MFNFIVFDILIAKLCKCNAFGIFLKIWRHLRPKTVVDKSYHNIIIAPSVKINIAQNICVKCVYDILECNLFKAFCNNITAVWTLLPRTSPAELSDERICSRYFLDIFCRLAISGVVTALPFSECDAMSITAMIPNSTFVEIFNFSISFPCVLFAERVYNNGNSF